MSHSADEERDYPAGVPLEDEPERFIEGSLESDEIESAAAAEPATDTGDSDAEASAEHLVDLDGEEVDAEVNDG
jgi:hypothetical protein